MSPAELRKKADIAPNTMTRMRKDQEVTVQVLERIYKILDADFGNIMEYVPDGNIEDDMHVDNLKH